MLRPTRLALFGISALLLLAVSCGLARQSQPAPDFEVALYDGTTFRLSEAAGEHALVLNFWYPSCPPCRAEMPDFERAWQELQGEDVRFLGLFVPQGLDSEEDARSFIGELGLTYDFATDRGARIAREYQIQYFPTTYFIDKSGNVYRAEISVLDTDRIVRLVRDMARS